MEQSTSSKKLRWYHWIGGVVLAAIVFALLEGGESSSPSPSLAACKLPMRGDNFKAENISACTFIAEARAYSPTRVRELKIDSINSLCSYTERDINADSLSHEERVPLLSTERARSGVDGKPQLIFKCGFAKLNTAYFVYNEGDFSIVEVDGDPNGSFFKLKR